MEQPKKPNKRRGPIQKEYTYPKGRLCAVNRISMKRGMSCVRVALSPGGWCDLPVEGPLGVHLLKMITSLGLVAQQPMTVWLKPGTKTIAMMAPCVRTKIIKASDVDDGLYLFTQSPRPLLVPNGHPRFNKLKRAVLSAQKRKQAVYIASALTGAETVDVVGARTWHRRHKRKSG